LVLFKIMYDYFINAQYQKILKYIYIQEEYFFICFPKLTYVHIFFNEKY